MAGTDIFKAKRLTWTLALVCLLLTSCAKKLERAEKEPGHRTDRNQTTADPDIQKFFNRQRAVCHGECHASVAKLVIYDRKRFGYCTGVLIAEDIIVTSSNCLSRNLKQPNISCVNSVFAVFPGVSGSREIKRMCDVVISSSILEENGDPALWRNDFTFLKLKAPVERRPVAISREGISETDKLLVWKMEYFDDYNSSLKRETCSPLFNSYANPFAQKWSSPMIPVTDCGFNEGNLGAPLFNERGELAALFSSKMSEAISTYLSLSDVMAEKPALIQHSSNFACAQIPIPGERDFSPDQECFKRIDLTLLDRHRSRMLHSRQTHQDNMLEIENELERPQKYFQWDIKFYSDKRGSALEAHFGMPKCFFDIDSWISEFSRGVWRRNVYTYGFIEVEHPRYVLETKLSRFLRPVSVMEKGESKRYKIEFNPAQAYFSQNTEAVVTGELFGSSSTQTYQNITDQCGERI